MDIVYEIEAILFLYGDEMEIERLEKFFDVGKKDVLEALGKLKSIREKSGINLKVKNGKVSLTTNPKYGETIYNFFNPKPKPKKLSKAAL
jgi:chromosome segregation and condensation protein ScpB